MTASSGNGETSDDEPGPTVGESRGSRSRKPHPLERFAVVLGQCVDIPSGWDRVTPGESARRGDLELDVVAMVREDTIRFVEVEHPQGLLVIRFCGDQRLAESKRKASVRPMRIKGR